MTEKCSVSSNQDTYQQRCIDAAVILAKWSLYFDLSGAKPVSGDLRDNPVLALLQDTREWLKRPLPADETKPAAGAYVQLNLDDCRKLDLEPPEEWVGGYKRISAPEET